MSEESVESGGESTSESGESEGQQVEMAEFFGDPGDLASGGPSLHDLGEVLASGASETDGVLEEAGQDVPEAPAEGTAPEGEAKPARMITLKNGQSFPAETPIEVSGEEIQLGLVVDDYIGQKEINRRFSEFDKNKKQWETDVVKRFEENEALTSVQLKKLNELSAKGDNFGVLNLIAQFAGKDPIEFEQQMVTQALDLADKFTEMSEDEVKAHWAEKRADYAKNELKRRDETESQKKARVDQEQAVRKAINGFGLSEAQFTEAYNVLKADEGSMEVLRTLPANEATARVCNFYLDSVKEARVEKALDEVAPKHPERDKLVDMLFRVADHDYSVEDIKEIASKYLKTGTNGAPGTPSKEAAPPKEPARPEKAASTAESNLTDQDPEDVLGWDFT